MKRSTLSRGSYRLILRIHPRAFRERFADAMLLIFDEESRQGAAFPLLWDGVVSLLRHHAKNEANLEPMAPGFGILITHPGISPLRFVQAGLTASILLLGFLFALHKSDKPLVPIQLPEAIHRAPLRVQAPSRIEPLPIGGQ
jgi:hypothetical protein